MLKAGAYRYTSSAQLTGPLTLDAEGDPNAQFVFEIGSSLTTASASSVVLLNGASPCNVYWQVGSSATLGTHHGVPGQPDGAREHLAQQRRDGHRSPARAQRRGHADQQRARQHPLQHRIHADADTGYGHRHGTGTAGGAGTAPIAAAKALLAAQANETTNPKRTTTRNGTTSFERTPHATCTSGFRATVRGKLIKRVVFSLDGKRIANLAQAPVRRVRARACPARTRSTRA